MKKQSLIRGSLILGVAGIMSKMLGIFFRWPIIMLLKDEGVGYYQLPFPFYMMFISFIGGVPVAVSKLVSEAMAEEKEEEAYEILRQAMKFTMFMAIGTTVILLLGSKYIIKLFNWDSNVYMSFMAMAITPIMVAAVTTYRGFFQGMQNMNPTAISQVIEQVGRVIFGVLLAYILLPYGIAYGAAGAALGAGIGGFCGGIYLYIKYKKIKPKFKSKTNISKDVMAKIFDIAIPIGIGMLVTGLMGLADSLLIPKMLVKSGYTTKEATIIFAQFSGKANVLVNLPLSLSVALSASMIPIISEHCKLKQFAQLKDKVSMAMKFSFVIAFPAFLGLFFLAEPILELIFPGQAQGYEILKYLSISIPFIIVCQTVISVLQACGKLKEPIIFLMIGVVVKVLINIYLIPVDEIGINGAVIGSIMGYLIPAIMSVVYMEYILKNKLHQERVDYLNVMIKPLIASVIMIIGVMAAYIYLLGLNNSMKRASLISISLGIIIYIVSIVILGVFKYDYIKDKFVKR